MGYQQALSLLSQYNRSNPSDYRVVLPARLTQLNPFSELDDYVSFFCRAATLPGSAHTIVNVKGQENIGISRPMITGRNFGSPAIFTFSDRADLLMYTTLRRWMDSCVVNSSQDTATRSLRVNYYDDIKSDMFIYKLEPKYDPTNTISPEDRRNHIVTGIWQLINCIPLAIEQSTLAVEATDSLMDFTISIAYESFTFKPISDSFVTNLFASVSDGSLVQNLTNINLPLPQ